MSDRFSKSSRLSSRKVIEQLFAKGHKIRGGNLLCIYLFETIPKAGASHQVAIGIAKNKKMTVVERNTYKRRIKEAYRTVRKEVLPSSKELDKKINLFFLFYPAGATSMSEVKKEMRELLIKLRERCKANR